MKHLKSEITVTFQHHWNEVMILWNLTTEEQCFYSTQNHNFRHEFLRLHSAENKANACSQEA